MEPASIRYRNPGGQYPGPMSARHGSSGYEVIGGGHKIAVFPDAESGAAAQFDLLASSYAGMPLRDLVRKWSGGNSNDAYTAHIAKALNVSPDTVITRDMLADPTVGIPFAKAAAQWEAGRAYPMTDAQWAAAHGRVFGSPTTPQEPVQGIRVAEAPTPAPTTETPPAASPAAPMSLSDMLGDVFREPEKGTQGPERLAMQFEDMQPMQLRMPQARRVDLSRLKAALQSRRA